MRKSKRKRKRKRKRKSKADDSRDGPRLMKQGPPRKDPVWLRHSINVPNLQKKLRP